VRFKPDFHREVVSCLRDLVVTVVVVPHVIVVEVGRLSVA
jgi:hypothetical protein